jgi:double-strand break repair protein AddB
MLDLGHSARVFGVAPGADFPRALINGLRARLQDAPPDSMARVTLIVNTRRMQRRLKAIFEEGPAGFLPKIKLLHEFGQDMTALGPIDVASSLRRRLELSQLVTRLLEKETAFAPRSSIFDLADSLASLLEEMEGEGVAPSVLQQLDVTDQSGHWQRTLAFVQLIEPFFSGAQPGSEAHQRRLAEALREAWANAPPKDPIVLAGSTGSRGATALLMQAIATLPQGAVVLPGFDFDMTPLAWRTLDQRISGEDHPQYRFAALAHALDIAPTDIQAWSDDAPPKPSLNRLISLSLRPAPVTDQWLTEGAALDNLQRSTDHITLLEADTPRAEATAIALMLRDADERGVSAALISPDRQLTRQVTAALDRWGIVPDDSAGRPLAQSAPGRLLRQVSRLSGRKITADALLALLKHPLVATGGARGPHLLHTRELELWLRRRGPAFISSGTISEWSQRASDAGHWSQWLIKSIEYLSISVDQSLTEHLRKLVDLAEHLCAWPEDEGSGQLWEKEAGAEARRIVAELQNEAEHGGSLSPRDFSDLFDSVLSAGVVREAIVAHPKIMIWGTLEARVQGAELVILGGLNEGSWPPSPRPDPWLNRALRDRAGLLLPEREIGLSAHDYQQAACAETVVLSRSVRDAEAQTVPARWINRLCNLLDGLSGGGPDALAEMRSRGQRWLSWAEQLDQPSNPVPAAIRPAPQPPVDARPSQISITEVQRLIRDPYAIYARRVLGLSRLDPLRRTPDAPLRGTIFHSIFEKFVAQELSGDLTSDIALLMQTTDAVLDGDAAWPAANRLWRTRIQRLAEWFVKGEHARREMGEPVVLEGNGSLLLADLGVTLAGKIDRIDRLQSGRLAVYDYKTGTVPSRSVQEHFDKQLLLSALVATSGTVQGLAASKVDHVSYIGLGSKLVFDPKPLEDGLVEKTRADLLKLLASYQDPSQGYTSRRAVDQTSFACDYDHLARYGEWDERTPPSPEQVG